MIFCNVCGSWHHTDAWHNRLPSVPDSPSTALQDQPAANDGAIRANEAPTSGVLATWMTVDAGTDREHEAWVPWPFVPAVAESECLRLQAEVDRLNRILLGTDVLPAMHCRDENGREMALKIAVMSNDGLGEPLYPLYRLVEVDPR